MPYNQDWRRSENQERPPQRTSRNSGTRRSPGAGRTRDVRQYPSTSSSYRAHSRYADNRAAYRSNARRSPEGSSSERYRAASSGAGVSSGVQIGKLGWLLLAIAGVAVVALVFIAIRLFIPGNVNDDRHHERHHDQSHHAAVAENDGSVVLTLLGDENTVVLAGEEYIEPGAQAFDRNKGQIEANVQISGTVDTSTPGDYEVVYRVKNDAGKEATRTRTVHVVKSMDVDQDGVPVFMYHWVYTGDSSPDSGDPNWISAESLEEQLRWLKENDYYFPSHREIRAYVDGTHSLPAKSVVLTFDDGEDGFMRHGIPLFNKYKIPATSYLIGNDPNTPAKISEFANDYVSLQSHSYGWHDDGKSGLGHGGAIFDMNHEELREDAKKMNDMLGLSPSMAYPCGDATDDAASALAEAGVVCAYTVEYGNVHKGDDPMRLNRVRVFGESSLDGWIHQLETGE